MDGLKLSGLKYQSFLPNQRNDLLIDDNKNASEEKEKKLKQVCADFESILIYYMFKAMRKTVPDSGFLNKMPGNDTYTMLFDQKIAEEMSRRNTGMGIQQIFYEQLKRYR